MTSRSTRATDRREKREAYQRIPSLRSYIIVEQRWREVILYERDDEGEWLSVELQGNGDLVIPPFGARLSLDDIYDDVPMPPLGVREDEWELSDGED